MKNVFMDWENIRNQIKAKKCRLFLFDFDGTLSKIVQHPPHARLDDETRRWLNDLSRIKGNSVGIVSGRALKDVRKKVGIRSAIYSGNHGLELTGPKIRFHHPQNKSLKMNLSRLVRKIRSQARRVPGLYMENKGVTASLHFRSVRPGDRFRLRQLKNHIDKTAALYGFQIRTGKKVYELRPREDGHKGNVVTFLIRKFKNPFVFFIGDDRTDEDAFRVVKNRGIAIRVGKKKTSLAPFYLPSRKDVPRLLKRMVKLWN